LAKLVIRLSLGDYSVDEFICLPVILFLATQSHREYVSLQRAFDNDEPVAHVDRTEWLRVLFGVVAVAIFWVAPSHFSVVI
jgi:hypothetical protein